jgi:hypothetical protein
VKAESFLPEIHLNAARVYAQADRVNKAVEALRRGLRLDPGNREMRRLLRGIERRRTRVLRFLPRSNILNRILGQLRHWVMPPKRKRRKPLAGTR